MRGKTIRLFLVDGTPTGLIAAEVMGWTGKVYVAPRAQIAQLRKRPEALGAGTYLLVGPDPDVPGRLKVYIGESDAVGSRLPQHDRDESKEFYERAVVLVSKDENLTKAHAKYLEARLIAMARTNGSATLTNDTRGSLDVRLPEPDVADMESFLDQAQMVLPVLGLTFTQPVLSAAALAAKTAQAGAATAAGGNGAGTTVTSPVFTLSVVGAVGQAQEVDGQFFLLAGSTSRKQGVNAWTSYKVLRDQLVASHKLVDHPTDPANFVAPEDIPMSSPSAAAAVVAARNMNGRQSWRTEGGMTYQDWVDSRTLTDA